MEECIADVEKAFQYGQDGKTISPIRFSVPHEKLNAETLYMPSYIEAEDYTSVKVVSIFPTNASKGRSVLQSVTLLTDAVTGEHVAMMNASYLTILRTGASSGVATKYLARQDSKTCAVLGCGAQSLGQIQAVMAVQELDQIILYNRTIEKARMLSKELRMLYPDWSGRIRIEGNPNEAVRHSDIVICSTKSNTPIFNGDVLRAGTHINAIGSYQPHMQEVDVQTLLKSNKIVVDTKEGALHEAGDFLVPLREGLWNPNAIFGEIGDIICGKIKGRSSDDEITLYKSVGIGYLDTMVAVSVYNKAIAAGIGMKFDI